MFSCGHSGNTNNTVSRAVIVITLTRVKCTDNLVVCEADGSKQNNVYMCIFTCTCVAVDKWELVRFCGTHGCITYSKSITLSAALTVFN